MVNYLNLLPGVKDPNPVYLLLKWHQVVHRKLLEESLVLEKDRITKDHLQFQL